MITIGELATKTAILSPRSPALIEPGPSRTRSFGDLAARTDLLAGALAGPLSARPGSAVAALAKNSIELVELYVGCAKAGALLFPLNWRFSTNQIAQALADAKPVAVFYDAEFEPVVSEVQRSVDVPNWIAWSGGAPSPYEDLLDRAATSRATVQLPGDAVLLHEPYLAVSTGGTTGIPKSAVHTQATYAACSIDYMAAARVAPTDTYLMLGQLFHVIGYMPIAYLAHGRPVVIADFDADELLDVIESERVSGFMAIATMLPRLVNAAGHRKIDTSAVRQVEYGGAPMGEEVIREAGEVFEADLLQAWGMTEFGPGTYLSPDAHRRALSGKAPQLLRSCGNAALFSTVAVLGQDGQPVPQDGRSMGEVCHRGPNNMIGYWNNPTETAEVMQDGWIHTGDGGAWDDEGFVYIVDRLKSMIITGGENVFPAEVERTLANHPAIAEVVVVGVPHPDWGEVVKAVVVRRQGVALSSEDVSAYVETQLGSYKKPRLVEFMDELPMTPTGKVNRKLLSEAAAVEPPA